MNHLRLLILLPLPLTISAKDTTVDETAVWKLEESYWQHVKANNLEAYRTLWDDNFLGWPNSAPHPLGKASISDGIPPLHADPDRRYDYRLQRKAVRAFGDSVVAYYLVWDVWRDPNTGAVIEEVGSDRITHTWQRRGDGWQIITGMSASYDH